VDAVESLAVVLRMRGHEVRAVHDGPSALTLATAFMPDLVLLDIGMPGMDGYEVARRARLEPEAKGVTLIALTGWGQEEDRGRSKEAGIDFHLVKPVDPSALQELLTSLHPRQPSLSKPMPGKQGKSFDLLGK